MVVIERLLEATGQCALHIRYSFLTIEDGYESLAINSNAIAWDP